MLRFEPAEGAFNVHYHEHRLPIAPESYPALLGERMDTLALKLNEQDPQLLELQSLISAFGHLPGREETDVDRLLERQRDTQLHKQRLARLCADSADIARHLEETVAGYEGDPQDPRSFDALHALLERQPYRLAHWHVAADEINYRRFFDIHDLAALRMEDSRVFESTHQLVMRLVQAGEVSGLRIDHPDGLYDPQAYFQRLQEQAGSGQAAAGNKPLYLLVEKILAPEEQLPAQWPVHGTTGYDFLSLVNALLVAPQARHEMLRFYRNFSGEDEGFEVLVYRCKRLIMKYALASELNMLAFALSRMAEADRRTRDFTLNRLRQALAEFIAWLPVYRTYIRGGLVSNADRARIMQALDKASAGSRAEEVEVYRFLRHVLLRENLSGEASERADHFVMKWQQYTGAVMAKGLEDTAFYRYFPLISLNEVGSHPTRFGLTVEQFHQANADRRQQWPHAMLATSSHDNKRSEDVRARINVLSELSHEWREQVQAWAEIARESKRQVDGDWAPSRNDEYLLYQTLIGAWPLGEEEAQPEFVERIAAYMLKAVREAKRHTSWINPNQAYEDATTAFVRALLADERFLLRFVPFQQRVARFGQYNSLSQTLLKLTAPGVPDIYQGNELWDFSLVDPDNRQPIDYPRRQELLRSLPPPTPPQMRALLNTSTDSRIKLALTHHALRARRRYETLFRDGSYQPLAVSGQHAEHLVAFARQRQGGLAVILAPRLYAQLLGDHRRLPLGAEVWGDTRIDLSPVPEAARFDNPLTGATLAVEEEEGRRYIRAREALSDFPVALLIGTI